MFILAVVLAMALAFYILLAILIYAAIRLLIHLWNAAKTYWRRRKEAVAGQPRPGGSERPRTGTIWLGQWNKYGN